MCIINKPVKSVSNTSIFVAAGADGNRQLTIYSNTVDTFQCNTMILPFPLLSTEPLTTQIVYYDATEISSFFDTLESTFSYETDSDDLCDNICAKNIESLPVFDIGSYQVSTAYSVSDLLRVDKTIFSLSTQVASLLNREYANNFGFVICQLKEGCQTYEPFAYSHYLLKDTSTGCGRLFVPTKHYHADEGENGGAFSLWKGFQALFYDKAHWDHNIYVSTAESVMYICVYLISC